MSIAGLSPARIAELTATEDRRFKERRPKSQAMLARAPGRHAGGT
jgi:hypothetical protein